MSMTSRCYAFTAPDVDKHWEELLQETECRYVCYAKLAKQCSYEQYYAGYVYFKYPRTVKSVEKAMPGLYLVREPVVKELKLFAQRTNAMERGDRPITPEEKGEKERKRWRDMECTICTFEGKPVCHCWDVRDGEA